MNLCRKISVFLEKPLLAGIAAVATIITAIPIIYSGYQWLDSKLKAWFSTEGFQNHWKPVIAECLLRLSNPLWLTGVGLAIGIILIPWGVHRLNTRIRTLALSMFWWLSIPLLVILLGLFIYINLFDLALLFGLEIILLYLLRQFELRKLSTPLLTENQKILHEQKLQDKFVQRYYKVKPDKKGESL